jgi:hypothetical protein
MPKRRNWIKSVGVELEGGIWQDVFDELSRDEDERIKVGWDGSVYVEKPEDTERPWVSDAEIRFWSEDPETVLYFVKWLFESGFKQNRTCGNHMHYTFHFQPIVITCISNINFVNDFLLHYISKFGNREKYKRRLDNNYCRDYGNDIDLDKNYCYGDRYRAINFDAIHKHGTLEIRVMPHAYNFDEYKEMFWFNYNTLNFLISKYVRTIKVRENILSGRAKIRPVFMSGIF